MEQAKRRSLTESEKAAEKTLIMLMTLRLVPAYSYDFVTWSSIERIAFEKDEIDRINEIRGRNVMFEWEAFRTKVTLVLRQERSYALSTAGEYSLLEDRKGLWWTTESIEIVSEVAIWSSEKRKEIKLDGKIVLDNKAAVKIMEDAARSIRPNA